MKKAIAYVSDVILERTKDVISRESQMELIKKHAEQNGIEITAWYEDERYEENVLARPGVQKMLAHGNGCNTVLVERVWAFSRKMTELDPLFAKFDKAGLKLESATTMWDCISQRCRHRFCAVGPERTFAAVTREEAGPVRIRRPAKLNFVMLQAEPSSV
jgi:hypothetical protein